MPTYQQAADDLREGLSSFYDRDEASAITSHVLYHITGLNKLDRMAVMDKEMPAKSVTNFNSIKERLIQGVPFQYVVGEEFFLGRAYNVSSAVLIPRPETEELVLWMDRDNKNCKEHPLNMLEVGTGSGCIAISLKCNFLQSTITAIDISPAALEVAKANADRHKASVDFQLLDFLNEQARDGLGTFHLIVSNPPYIPETERESLHTNVRDHEPAEALFVPGNDPLLFYRAIAGFGLEHLAPRGAVYCELHRDYAGQAEALFKEFGYTNVAVRDDMHGAPRMLRAQR